MVLAVLEGIFKLGISLSDTAIRDDGHGNFAENLLKLPRCLEETWHYVRNHKNCENSYVDVGKYRLVTNTADTRMKVSDLIDGKISYLGTRLTWANTRWKCALEVLSLYQDILLCSIEAKRCAYLPVQLTGMGKPIPFRQPSNYESFITSYKHGNYTPFLREVIRDVNANYRLMVSGELVKLSPLLEHCAKCTGQFRDWLKTRSLYLPKLQLEELPHEVEDFLVGTMDKVTPRGNLLARLASKHLLVREETLMLHAQRARFLQSILSDVTWMQTQIEREEILNEWRSYTPAILYEIGLATRHNINIEDHPLKDDDVSFFMKAVIDDHRRLLHLFRSERVYTNEALELVESSNPMRVGMEVRLTHPLIGIKVRSNVQEEVEAVLEHNPGREILERSLKWVKDGIGPMPTDLVEDDPVLKRRFMVEVYPHAMRGVVLVTDDYELVKEIKSYGSPTIMAYPSVVGDDLYDESNWQDFLPELPGFSWVILRDTGSILSYDSEVGDYDVPDGWPWAKYINPARSGTSLANKRFPVFYNRSMFKNKRTV